MTDLIALLQGHLAEIIVILGLALRLELSIAKLTKNTTDDAIGQKIADALKPLGVDPTKPQ